MTMLKETTKHRNTNSLARKGERKMLKKRLVAWVLMFALCFYSMPVYAFAQEASDTADNDTAISADVDEPSGSETSDTEASGDVTDENSNAESSPADSSQSGTGTDDVADNSQPSTDDENADNAQIGADEGNADETENGGVTPDEGGNIEEGTGEEDNNEPAEPTDPSNTETPAVPAEPTEPAEPADPENPEQPTEPVQPADPETPNTPADPDNQETPAEPEQPVGPVEPADPEQPAQPAEPQEPVVTPEEPIVPEEPKEIPIEQVPVLPEVNQVVDNLQTVVPPVLEVPVVPPVPEISAEVQAFLDAVDQLPESVTKETLTDVTAMLENILSLFTQLTEEEQESEEVTAAYMLVLALWEQCEGVKAALLNEDAVTTLEALQAAIDDAEKDVVTVGADITGNIEINRNLTLDLGGYTLTGNGNCSVITVKSAEVTIQNGTVTGGKAFEGGGIYVASDAIVTLADGAIVRDNVAETNRRVHKGLGGGVYVDKGGVLSISGAQILNNKTDGDPFDIRSDNEANGGGIYVSSGATFTMTSGLISQNEAIKKGGGICLGSDGYGKVDVDITGGIINENVANTGGGLYVARGTTLELQKVVVSGNRHNNPGLGGAVWFCGVGEGYFYATNGAYISDNHSDSRGDDFSSSMPYEPKEFHFNTRLFDGTPLVWYPDGKNGEWDGPRYDVSTKPIENFEQLMLEWLFGEDNMWGDPIALHTETVASPSDSYYKVYIQNNEAIAEGSGIACNGSLIMGEDSDIKLTVHKVWDVEEGTELPKEITVKVLNNGADFETLTLNADNDWQATLIDLPGDRTYTVEEVTVDGYVADYSKMIEADDFDADSNREYVITVTNKVAPETGNLIVSKTVKGEDLTDADKITDFNFTVKLTDDTINGEYGEMTFEDGVATFTLQDGQQKTSEGLPQGIGYTVTEEAAVGFNSSSTGEKGTIAAEDSKAEFVNTKIKEQKPEKISVSVVKVWFDDTEADRPEQVVFKLLVDGVATQEIILNADTYWKATINGLDASHNYAVEEVEVEGYTSGAPLMTEDGKNYIFTVTNTKITGNLTVSKTVTVTGAELDEADRSREFNFTVTLSDNTINGEYGDMTFVNGVAQFTLKHGESKTAAKLPVGVTYTVVEQEAAGYSTSAAGDQGTISEAGAAAAFVNNRVVEKPQPKTGSLTVNKTVVVNGAEMTEADRTTEFNFTVTLSDTSINGAYGAMNFVDGVATFTLKHNDSITANDLPTGINYTVAEQDNAGYQAASVGETGTIIEAGAVVAFTNTRTVTPPPTTPDNPGDDNPGGDEPETPPTPTTTVDEPPVPLTETPDEEIIIDEDVPLSGMPDEDEEVLLDEEVPLAQVPKTGDNLLVWFFAAMASGLAALGLGRKRD